MISSILHFSFKIFSVQAAQYSDAHTHLVSERVNRGVQSIRDLKLPVVVVLILLGDPFLLDSRKGGASIAARMAIRNWRRSPSLAGENAGIRLVEVSVRESWGRIPRSQSVSSVGRDIGEDVGTDVPSSESVEVPVRFDG